ncbi:MAG: tRNA-specific adenosine deaminase [Deltaproteobacteria bacterium]|nr:MAG: tRNA-specific adenosine deaminase [Deltaproteobacteria bacterium]
MKIALHEAIKARGKDEVPVGAVIADTDGNIIAKSHNMIITLLDPTAHAEINVLKEAAKKTGNYRLTNAVLYSTLEPCLMCMGALIHARIKKVVFGTFDKKWGAAGSLYSFHKNINLNHRPEIISGVLEDECRELIQKFFQEKRKIKKGEKKCPVLP